MDAAPPVPMLPVLPVSVVWLAPAPPDPDQRRALEGWSTAHRLRLDPPPARPPAALPIDLHVADTVEGLLDRAGDAIAARDGDAADRALDAAASALHQHPELPQSAWLMAEVERTRSARCRWVAPTGAAEADRAWRRADALDGGRAPGVGEQAAPASPPDATLALDFGAPSAEARARTWVDGVPAAAVLALRSGPHVLVTSWADAITWATWVDVPIGTSSLRVGAPAPLPCSAEDLAEVRATTTSAEAKGAHCPHWIAAIAGQRQGSVRLAECELDRCGAWILADPVGALATASWPGSGPATGERSGARSGWPAWASWALFGAGAALGAGAVFVGSGGFRGSTPETRFVSGGLKTQ
jgi:hypothetical protein